MSQVFYLKCPHCCQQVAYGGEPYQSYDEAIAKVYAHIADSHPWSDL